MDSFTPEAIKKAEQVFEAAKPYFTGEDKYDNYVATLEKIGKPFGGVVWDTGGNIKMAVIPVDDHQTIVLDEGGVGLYYCSVPSENPMSTFRNFDEDRFLDFAETPKK